MTDISRKVTSDWDEYWSYDSGNDVKKNFFAYKVGTGIIEDSNSIFYKTSQWDVFITSMSIGRYYNERKERRESVAKADKPSLTFEHKKRNHSSQKGRGYQIIFLIIILSLLAYKLLIS